MVAKTQITTFVDPDGSVHLSEQEMARAGIRAGDRILVAIVPAPEPTAPTPPDTDPVSAERRALSAAELAALPFDEWLAQFRADFPIDPDVDVEEMIRHGEELVADEFWERFNAQG